MAAVSRSEGGDRSSRTGDTDPDDRYATSAAVDRDRSGTVRRTRIRSDVDRGDRPAGERVQAGRLRALRRQGGPVRRGRGSGDVATAGDDHVLALAEPLEEFESSGLRWRCSPTWRSTLTDSGSSCAIRPSWRRGHLFESPQRCHQSGGLPARRGLLAARFRPGLATMYAQALVGMVSTTATWWLDERTPSKEVVAAHLVNLCWNGLTNLEADPQLGTDRSHPAAR